MVALALLASSSGASKEPKEWRTSAITIRIGRFYFLRGINARRGRMWAHAGVGGIHCDGRSYRSAWLGGGNWRARRRGHCQWWAYKASVQEPINLKWDQISAPILSQFSIFDTPDGRLRGLCGGDETSSFFGIIGRDQGAMGRPKSGLDRRFSLTEVGCASKAETGTGGGGMRGS